MAAKKLICSAAVVGMLFERGLKVPAIVKKVGHSERTVRRYLQDWMDAAPSARYIARRGTAKYLKGL